MKAVFLTLIVAMIQLSCATGAKMEKLSEEKSEKSQNLPIQWTLPNGMRVIAEENHSAPVVAVQVWVRVGSADEGDEEAGICHLIEHMLFKGTEKQAMGELARTVEALGGNINAFTTFDHTVYHIAIPSMNIKEGLNLLADAINHPAFDPVELKKEKEVVLEEIRMGEDTPSSELTKALFKTAYTAHSYRRPVIGYNQTVSGFLREKVIDFYNHWYVPNNMLLVIAGDLTVDEVKPMITSALGSSLSSGSDPHGSRPKEPTQNSPRSVVLNEGVQEAYLSLAFHIPPIANDDIPALDVLSEILGTGESSRLFQEVKAKKGLVNSIYTYTYTPKDPGILLVEASLEPAKMKESLDDILNILFESRYLPITDEELDKAKLSLESDLIYQRNSMEGIARQWGYFDTVAGGAEFKDAYLAHLKAINISDVYRVAKQYLSASNSTIAMLAPDGSNVSFKEDELNKVAITIEKMVAARYEKKTGYSTVDGIIKARLGNGMNVLIKEDHTLSTVAIQLVFPGGLLYEEKGNSGINNFIAQMLTQGTKNRTAFQIAQEIDSMAGSLNGFSGRNSFGVKAEFLSQFLDRGLDLFQDIVINPTFPKEEVEKKRVEILAQIKNQEDELTGYTFNLFLSTLYVDHPYGMNILGTKDSVSSLDTDALSNYYKTHTDPSKAVIAIVGDINSEEVLKKIGLLFGEFYSPSSGIKKSQYKSPENGLKEATIYKEKEQAHIVYGFVGTVITSQDRYALEVLDAILSGQGGKLFRVIRDERGLAYVVSFFNTFAVEPGYLGVYIGCSPEKVESAINGIEEVLKETRESEVDQDSLQRAKNYLVGNYVIGLQGHGSQAQDISLNELYGLGADYYKKYPEMIKKVTAQDVQAVTKKYLKLEARTLTIVRPH